ncbi:MAG: hypothetical protein HOV87_06860 [Catenulispora sp.]|nr:hypothetical protein [Catenulispora sp.]
MMPSRDQDPVGNDVEVQQSARASQGGEVNQLVRGKQINGLSGKAAVAIVAAAMSIALGAFLALAALGGSEHSQSEQPINSAAAGGQSARSSPSYDPASGPLAGSANGIKVVLSAHSEGGLLASKYLPTAEEEREYLFNKFGEVYSKPGYHAFWSKQDSAHVGQYWYKLTIVNTGGTAVRIVDIKPVVLQREAPISEVLYPPCCGAGGEDAVRAALNLDDPHPSLMQGSESYFEGHSVSIGPGGSFDITIDSKVQKFYCAYYLDMQYVDTSGNLLHLKITNPGDRPSAPFALTAFAISGTYQRVYTPKLLDVSSGWRDGSYVRSDNQTYPAGQPATSSP